MNHPKIPPNEPLFVETDPGKWVFKFSWSIELYDTLTFDLSNGMIIRQRVPEWTYVPMQRSHKRMIASVAERAWRIQADILRNMDGPEEPREAYDNLRKAEYCAEAWREWGNEWKKHPNPI